MKIKVSKTTKAASDLRGLEVKTYQAGETVEIFDELAAIFIKEGWGVAVEGEEKADQSKNEKEIDTKNDHVDDITVADTENKNENLSQELSEDEKKTDEGNSHNSDEASEEFEKQDADQSEESETEVSDHDPKEVEAGSEDVKNEESDEGSEATESDESEDEADESDEDSEVEGEEKALDDVDNKAMEKAPKNKSFNASKSKKKTKK